jgi:hypothetical protein
MYLAKQVRVDPALLVTYQWSGLTSERPPGAGPVRRWDSAIAVS